MPEGPGELFRADTGIGAEQGEGARQRDHQGRAQGPALPALAGQAGSQPRRFSSERLKAAAENKVLFDLLRPARRRVRLQVVVGW